VNVTLSWSPVETVGASQTFYVILRSDNGGPFESIGARLVEFLGMDRYEIIPPVTFTDTTAADGHTYDYRIDAYGDGRTNTATVHSNLGRIVIPPADSFAILTPGNLPLGPKIVPMSAAENRTITGWSRIDDAAKGLAVAIEASSPFETGTLELGITPSFGDVFLLRTVVNGAPDGVTSVVLDTPAVGEWFFWALTFEDNPGFDSTNVTARWAYVSDNEFLPTRAGTIPWTTYGGAAQLNFDLTMLGGSLSDYGSLLFAGGITQTRQWFDLLTPTQLLAEKNSRVAVTPGAWSDNPMQGGTDYSDLSGNGNNWGSFDNFGTTDGPING
jgi:hypothetical protein